MIPRTNRYKAIVIGAGSAGLQCARALQSEHGIPAEDVLVLEARDVVGGRIQQTESFIPGHKVELGAEFVHGLTTRINQFADFYGWTLDEVFTWAQGDGGPSDEPTAEGGIGAYYLGKEKKMLSYDSTDPDFMHLNEVLWAMCDTQGQALPGEEKLSLDQYLKDSRVAQRMMGMAEAGYANTCGGSLKRISYGYQCASERYWGETDGDGDFRVNGSFSKLIDVLVDPQGPHNANPEKKKRGIVEQPLQIKTRTPVTDIVWEQPSGLVKVSTHSQDYEASCVVVTVPLPVLKNESYLKFTPPLPPAKVAAAKKVGLGVAVKLLLRFKSRGNIPDNLQGVICSDCFIPEMWFRMSPSGELLLTCFLMDRFGREAVAYGEDESIRLALEQVNEMFPPSSSSPNKKLTSDYFLSGKLHDWGSEPYVHVGYTHCLVNQSEAEFRELAKPLPNGRVFFAGEAYVSHGANMTVHSALDAGFRAAGEVSNYLKTSSTPQKNIRSRL